MPTVEKILPCRGGKSVNVLLSDGKKVRVSRAKLASLRPEIGREAPEKLLELLAESLTPERAKDAAARIAMRPVFSAEVREKLLARGFSAEAAGEAVDWLWRIGAVNDPETLALFLREAARRGKGRKTVRYELLRHGVDPEELEEALASYDGGSGALETLRKKLRGGTDRDSLRRGAALLYAKGFERDAVRRLLEEYMASCAGEDAAEEDENGMTD
ncbi:MAG: regulatory protein RecX [Clostridia bacterium]|nr:regulatory protein RecX [Clostridia bacterium]